MKVTKIRGACPFCYRPMISATDVFGDETPMHGDLSLCKSCDEISVFDFTRRKNTLRRPTAKERIAIEQNASACRLKAHRAERRLH
jgi:hypothetical protein